MHPNPRRVLPIVIVIGLAGALLWGWWSQRAAASEGALRVSGTIEATEVIVAPEMGGRVQAVLVQAGERVRVGQPLVTFDPSLLNAQRKQAEAALRAAEGLEAAARAGLDAAQANYDLLEAGPSAEQQGVAESAVARAQAAADAAQAAYDALPEAARQSEQAQLLNQQLELALATLDSARAQQAQLEAGPRPQQMAAAAAQVAAAEAQLQAAGGQVEAARAALGVLDAQVARLTLVSPLTGIVLNRAIEPGEVAMPGGALLQLADLEQLRITVYLPEDRYGAMSLGQAATVSVDSFPGERFAATVARIADRAEFTPRNVQTSEGRKSTVFAIELRVENPEGKLKPGMPADVVFGE